MTVCDNYWNLLKARMVCRMLGFDGALEAPGSVRFGQETSDIIDVRCYGTEESLADCPYIWTTSSCRHRQDAGAVCYSGAHPNPFEVRLVGGSNDAEGRVEIMHDGSWGTICDYLWELRDARVVCRMLGFDGALDAPGSARFGQGSGRSLLNYVNCDGAEDNLADCAHAGIGRYSCSHTMDAGAICYSRPHPNPFQVRLVGGFNDAEGRVEVMHKGSWGTICDDSWDLKDARVVCRMLGFDGALDAPGSARFGQGSGRILLNYVNCEGAEDNLADCAHERYSCSHTQDAGAVCFSGINPKPFQVRFVGGSNDAEGSVEVMHKGFWGTICDSWWDLRDARVVCRMLGFDGALDAPRSARYGQGSGRVLLKYVNCDGTEDNLADCAHPGIGRYTCSHTRDAGAVCYSGEPFQVRLTNGTTGSEGRVTVSYKGSWGTICDDNWDLRDGRVVCKMLGFDGALAVPGSATFGAGSGTILFDDVGCDGTEDALAECYHRGLGVNNCEHDRDAGVICFTGAPFQVHLVNGSNDLEGRVEVLYDGFWGTICDHEWDLRDARVVCKMLGFDGALAAPGSASFGQGSGDILLDGISCESTHDNLADCYHRGIGVSDCKHEEDSGAICFRGDPFKVRLTDGANDSEGRVEVMYDGSWGTVCNNGWDLNDATVICRMLGFDGALAATVSARFGQDNGNILLGDVQCYGTEKNIADCYHRGIGVHNCSHARDSGAICFSGVRLIGGANDVEGRVEILHDGSWGTVCDDSWDLKDAEVVCRMLGFGRALDAPSDARFGKGSGSIFLDEVQCQGTEVDIERCDHDGIGVHNCAHNEDASVICTPKGGTPFNLTLAIIIGLCVFLSSVFLVATLAYCVRRAITSWASRKLESDIYMDTGFTHDTSVVSTYQDLNAAPKLPERRLTILSENKLFDDEEEQSVPKTLQGENDHDYMETIFISKAASSAKDGSTDAISLRVVNKDTLPNDIPSGSRAIYHDETCKPVGTVQIIEQNNPHKYMVMNTVYKKLSMEKDVDVDGYLLPSKTKSGKKEPLNNAQTTERTDTHEYIDITNVNKKLLKGSDVDLDDYILPSASGLNSGDKPNVENAEQSSLSQNDRDIFLTSVCERSSSNEQTATLQQECTKQDSIHRHMDVKTICQRSSTLEDEDIDGYLLPSDAGDNTIELPCDIMQHAVYRR